MNIFKSDKENNNKKNIEDAIIHNEIGEELHILNGDKGPMIVKKLDIGCTLNTGEQWCPDCHSLMSHK
jgi:hypothetical protein